MDLANFSLVLLELAIPEGGYDFLQPAGLDISGHIILQVLCSMRLFPLAVGEHEGLVKACLLHQADSVLMLLLCLSTKTCVHSDIA